MQHTPLGLPLRRALALGAALSVVSVGGAYAAGSALTGQAHHDAKPAHETPAAVPTDGPTPNGPAALPDQASDRASQAIAERGRDAHAQGPKAETTEAADPTDDPTEDATEDATEDPTDDSSPTDQATGGPGYGPGVHAGPHGDYGPGNHPDSTNHPGGDDHPDSTTHPDTTNHPGH